MQSKTFIQLTSIDQDKVAKLYSQLRHESLAIGSLPITVRHIESIIRMAKASAKMHLRDHVQESDTNLAINILLDSFVVMQKYSVTESIHQEHLSYKKKHNELLYNILRQITLDSLAFQKAYQKVFHGGPITTVEISEKDLLEQVKRIDLFKFISNLHSFYESGIFKTNNFMYDSKRKVIV